MGNCATKSASGLALSSSRPRSSATMAVGSPVARTSRPKLSRGKNIAARQPERGIEPALEGGVEARDIDAERREQTLGDLAVERLGRLQRLAAAIADDQAAIEPKFVALGMAAEIVVIVEDEDARRRVGAAVEPGRRQPADPAADHHEVVALLDRQPAEGERPAVAQLVADLERAGMMAAHPGERRRIARRLRHDLRHGRKPGRDRERNAIEKITARDVGHARSRFSGTEVGSIAPVRTLSHSGRRCRAASRR